MLQVNQKKSWFPHPAPRFPTFFLLWFWSLLLKYFLSWTCSSVRMETTCLKFEQRLFGAPLYLELDKKYMTSYFLLKTEYHSSFSSSSSSFQNKKWLFESPTTLRFWKTPPGKGIALLFTWVPSVLPVENHIKYTLRGSHHGAVVNESD